MISTIMGLCFCLASSAGLSWTEGLAGDVVEDDRPTLGQADTKAALDNMQALVKRNAAEKKFLQDEKERRDKARGYKLRESALDKMQEKSEVKSIEGGMPFLVSGRGKYAICQMNFRHTCASLKSYKELVIETKSLQSCLTACENEGSQACAYDEDGFKCYTKWDDKSPCKLERVRREEENRLYAGLCRKKTAINEEEDEKEEIKKEDAPPKRTRCTLAMRKKCVSKKAYSRKIFEASSADKCRGICEANGSAACSYRPSSHKCFADWDNANSCTVVDIKNEESADNSYAGTCQ
jgi:hypothetical protein